MKTIILSRDRKINGWTGTLGKKPLYFPEATAGMAFKMLRDKYPGVKIGIKAADMGPACVNIYGETIWMKDAP